MSNVFKTGLLLAVLTAMLVLHRRRHRRPAGHARSPSSSRSVMNFVSYWFSDKIVLAAYGAQPIDEAQAPGLYAIVRRLASQRRHPDAARLRDPERDARTPSRPAATLSTRWWR